jgi:HSP20 family protein
LLYRIFDTAGAPSMQQRRGEAMKKVSKSTDNASEVSAAGLGGLLQGLGGFLDLVSNLAEREGTTFERQGEIGDEKGKKAVYGFSVRVGNGGKPKIEPFGNVIKNRGSGPAVEDEREPMVDTFDEESHVVVIAEMPGVNESDIQFEVRGDVLSIRAHRGARKYSKELQLPAAVKEEGAEAAYRNGILELKLFKENVP